MLGMEAVAERMSDNLVGHDPAMPGVGQSAQTFVTTRCFEYGLQVAMLTSNGVFVCWRSNGQVQWGLLFQTK